jgi:hypothetical protein
MKTRGRKTITTVNGVNGKICNGNYCNGTWQPISNYYSNKTNNTLQSLCKKCHNYYKSYILGTNKPFKSLADGIHDRRYKQVVSETDWEKYLKELWEVQGGLCAMTGFPMVFEVGHPRRVSPDRMNNKQGYVERNVRLVCSSMNFLRGGRSMEKFDPKINWIIDAFQKDRNILPVNVI